MKKKEQTSVTKNDDDTPWNDKNLINASIEYQQHHKKWIKAHFVDKMFTWKLVERARNNFEFDYVRKMKYGHRQSHWTAYATASIKSLVALMASARKFAWTIFVFFQSKLNGCRNFLHSFRVR